MKQIRFSKQAISDAVFSLVELRDTELPNLIIKLGKGGAYFHVRLYVDGNSTTLALGRFGDISIAEARKAARYHIHMALRKRYIRNHPDRFELIGELLSWYLTTDRSHSLKTDHTEKNISHRVTRLLIPELGEVKISALTYQYLHKHWLTPLLEHYSASSIRGAFQTLKSAFRYAERMEYLDENPVRALSFTHLLPVKIEAATYALEGKDLNQVCRTISRFPENYKMLALFCLCCLTRNAETTQAKWSEISFADGTWTIPASHTKTGISITLPLSPELCEMLRAHKREQRKFCRSVYLFPKLGGRKPISPSYASQMMRLHSKGQFRLHDLRKFGSSALRDAGVDYYIVERIMNHKKTALDETYIHTSLQHPMRHALDTWQRKVLTTLSRV